MEIPTHQNHVYTLTCENACEVYDVDTDRLLHEHHAGEAQSQFTAIGMKVRVTDDTAHVTEVFNGAAIGNGAGGGNINSDLNVGHGAADAVAAVCTLTLGDLAEGGTLTDGTTTLTLVNPHTKATGWVGVADAAAAGTIKFGGHGAIAFEAKAGAYARAVVSPLEHYETEQEYTLYIAPAGIGDTLDFSCTVTDPENALDEIVAALETASNWLDEATQSVMDEAPVSAQTMGDKIVLTLAESGEAGNAAEIFGSTSTLIAETENVPFAGGSTARTVREVVAVLNASADCHAVAELDADELGISFTAKEYGVNDAITTTGGLFEDAEGMEGGHGDYSVAELVSAINAETDFDVTAAAGTAEGAITLTANTAGAAANAVVYTATGCFGGGRVRQGSTTRGRNAVAQTAFKIYLNGEELDVEPAPLPTALTPTTAMRNGGVYTVTADATAQVYTAVTLESNATAEIWLTCTSDDNSVALPGSSEGWIWLDPMPDMVAGKTYAVAARNVGNAVLARPVYEYTTPAQS